MWRLRPRIWSRRASITRFAERSSQRAGGTERPVVARSDLEVSAMELQPENNVLPVGADSKFAPVVRFCQFLDNSVDIYNISELDVREHRSHFFVRSI
jgi:hypothetical protein